MEKPAPTDLPLHDLIRRRWSPRAFDARPVPREMLTVLFEAARWAPSCYNEQPWRYVVATAEEPEALERMRALLVDGNAWAKRAPVLALSVASALLARNGRPNPWAWHDTGAASENLFLQAVSMGLGVHEMGGFERDRAREVLEIPGGYEPVAMIAIGWPGRIEDCPEEKRAGETAPRVRRPPSGFVMAGRFGEPFRF